MKRAAIVFAVVTVAMFWPIARHPASVAVTHQDVYFNMWRLHWFAHALTTSPSHLFDANIFYPERGTLALSDSMLVEGLVAMPMILAGMRPVLVHNLLMLLPIAASGLTMFALARYLTGSRGAGLIAGLAFAFAPYRFDHLGHMELQWTVWMPLAFLAMHRTFDTGRWKYGLAMGASVALQMLSCVYYGVFLATLLTPVALLLSIRDRGVAWTRVAGPLVAGGVLAIAICAAYAIPFARQHARVGDRSLGEIATFSATPSSYVTVTTGNALYGDEGRPGREERRLFPGTLVVLLALTGMLLQPPSRRQIVYLLVAAAAFDASLGPGGFLFHALSTMAPFYRSLRAMGRLGIFVVMALAVLAAYGYVALMSARSATFRRIGCAAIACAMLVEYRTPDLRLGEFPNTAPPAYRLLSRLTPGVVAELPVPRADRLPGQDPRYAYMSIFHWFPLVNGYSGNYPATYLDRLDRLRRFPDARSLRQLEHDGVRYVIVHGDSYSPQQVYDIHVALHGAGMTELGEYFDGEGAAHIFAKP